MHECGQRILLAPACQITGRSSRGLGQFRPDVFSRCFQQEFVSALRPAFQGNTSPGSWGMRFERPLSPTSRQKLRPDIQPDVQPVVRAEAPGQGRRLAFRAGNPWAQAAGWGAAPVSRSTASRSPIGNGVLLNSMPRVNSRPRHGAVWRAKFSSQFPSHG